MTTKYQQKKLSQNLIFEQLGKRQLYYSYADKPGKMIGLMTTRLLIFSQDEDILTYTRKQQAVPFVSQKNYKIGQKQLIYISQAAQITNPPNTNKLHIKYKKVKENVMGQWILEMKTKNLAQQWNSLLNKYRDQRSKGILGRSSSKKNQDYKNLPMDNEEKNSVDQQYAKFFLENSAIRQTKKQEQVKKQPNNEHQSFFMNDSRMRQSQANKNQPSNSNTPNNNYENTNPQNISNSGIKDREILNILQNNKKNQLDQPNSYYTPQQQPIKPQQYNPNSKPSMYQSQESKINKQQVKNDWNFRFIESPTLDTIRKFQLQAKKVVQSLIPKDTESSRVLRIYDTSENTTNSKTKGIQGFIVKIADIQTLQAKQLKQQFRNYHYIIESCSAGNSFDLQAYNSNLQNSQVSYSQPNFVLGVPMSCLVQYNGIVALVKASFPKSAEIVQNKQSLHNIVGDLQKYTKINNNIIYNSECYLLDLSGSYGTINGIPRIYVDQLLEYLPELSISSVTNSRSGYSITSHQSKENQEIYNKFLLRPKLMEYNINRVIQGGSLENQQAEKSINRSASKSQASTASNAARLKNQIGGNILIKQIEDTAIYLSSEDIYVTNFFDLKEYLHERGINIKLLNKVAQQTSNKFVKKYIQTCLVAKLIKDQIFKNISDLYAKQKIQIRSGQTEAMVEDMMRAFIHGKSATNSQYWKKMVFQFRNTYGFSLNTHEIQGGFLLSCLMTLIPGKYNISKINKEKIIFEDQDIIGEGFLLKLESKTKPFYRFRGHPRDKIVETCKYSLKDRKIYQSIVSEFNLKQNMVPSEYQMNNGKLYILAYLSDYVAAKDLFSNTLPCAQEIYSSDLINCQPPSAPTMKITLSYLTQCLDQKRYDRFQQVLQKSIKDINFWLGYEHPQICDFYDKLSDYQALQGAVNKSIQILERNLQISLKTEAKNYKKIGIRYYALGNRNLSIGRKKEALNNLLESKKYLEKIAQEDNDLGQYPLMLMRLSSLFLNNGDINRCIQLGRQAEKYGEKMKINSTQLIKIHQILCRAYEINGDDENLRKLSLKCAKQFNKQKQNYVFDQMIKIGLTGTMAKLSKQKSQSIFKLAKLLKQENRVNNSTQSLRQLMQLAETMIVMQKFTSHSQHSDRIYSDLMNKKPLSSENQQFLRILALVAGVATLDFLEGLNIQKQYQKMQK